MKKFNRAVLNCLQNLKGSGKFASVDALPFVLPGLHIDNSDVQTSFPLTENEARKLITLAEVASFGKGRDTIVDTAVRNTWEIDAKRINLRNPQWRNQLDNILNTVKTDLGLEKTSVKANLYKLLIYEEGGFFLPHKDSEKEKGMFGTLVIDLPSQFTGGELLISFDKETVVADFADASPYETRFAAFYADCEHEVKTVTSGYRVCLVYNLIQQNQNQKSKITLSSVNSHADELAKIIDNHSGNQPYIFLLGHQYTPENFSYQNLKLNDRVKAEVILRAAKKLGFYSGLCLVTAYKAGMPAYYGYNEPNPEEMDEIFEESLEVKYWVESPFPEIEDIEFEEEDLIASFELEEGEPILKETTDYMGNYGPEVYYWYHYGAVVLWSPSVNAELIAQQRTSVQLAWIEYLTSNTPTAEEVEGINKVIKKGLLETDWYRQDAVNYNAIIDWTLTHGDIALLLSLDKQVLQGYFPRIDSLKVMEFLNYLTETQRNIWIEKIVDGGGLPVIDALVALLVVIPAGKEWQSLTSTWVNALPTLIEQRYSGEADVITAHTIPHLVALEKKLNLTRTWSSQMANVLLAHMTRKKVHTLVNQQLLGNKDDALLKQLIRSACVDFLQKLVDDKPEPPKDWARPLPESMHKHRALHELKHFLASPTQQKFDYRAVAADRERMEDAIKYAKLDLKMETIRKGRPYTLKLTKTRATYDKLLAKWKEDSGLLQKLICG